ncbi:YceI family protein [Corynebacterium sp. 13CS0277]|uniref:YceI family protein n=1 Tax=Corynebacterium sp. 13CS0277 TaxID=2071994 RepID=UPI001E4792EB|nr:YceI family protein [Corynebacterium sp. 13CS0277]
MPADVAGDYTLDNAHSEVGFVVKHAMVSKVRGHFNEFDAGFTLDKDGSGSVKATIKTASVDTDNDERDEHVRSDDFFASEKYPDMTFVADFSVPGASSVDDLDGTTFPVTGDLTLKGVTKKVTLDVTVDGAATGPEGETRLGFTATGKLNRTDFGVDFNAPLESGGLLLSEDITLEIEGSAVKK